MGTEDQKTSEETSPKTEATPAKAAFDWTRDDVIVDEDDGHCD